MVIRNKIVIVYDIELFPNCFYCTLKDTESNINVSLEISHRKNDVQKIINFFHRVKTKVHSRKEIRDRYIFCGYNNIHYDNVIINYIIANRERLLNYNYIQICNELFDLSNQIVRSGDGIQSWDKWKYLIYFDTLDLLTMLFSKKLRVSLKSMQVTMQYPNVQEYEGDFSKPISDTDIPKMAAYNINDVESTTELLNRCKPDIDLRIAIEDEYNIDVLNKDGVNIGMRIIAEKYLEETGLQWKDIKDLRDPCDIVDLNQVILPFIKFDTPILQDVLEELKKQKVSPGRKGYERHFLLDNVEYTVGVGGIHTVNMPDSFIADENWIISDVDVTSLYPSLIIQYNFYPPQLGKAFLHVYSKIKEERVEAKRLGIKTKDATLKLALNGLSFSPFIQGWMMQTNQNR